MDSRMFEKDYGNVADIEIVPARTEGGIVERNRFSIMFMKDRKTGLYYILDEEGNAKVSLTRDLNIWNNGLHGSSKDYIKQLSEWEKRTGNVV
jgi:hypothetical protein